MTRPAATNDSQPTVVLDANVLFSQVLSDYFVQARSQRLVRLRWSRAIVDEMINRRKDRVAEKRIGPAERAHRLRAIDNLRGYIERTYPKEFIEPAEEHFAPFADLPMPDPDDRKVLATAVAASAQYLCTANVGDFPDAVMDHVGIRRTTPDELLQRLVFDYPAEMVSAHQTVIEWTRGATHLTTLDTLGRAQAPGFKAALEDILAPLGDLSSTDDLAAAYASALAGRDRAHPELVPPSTRRPPSARPLERLAARPRARTRLEQQRGVGS